MQLVKFDTLRLRMCSRRRKLAREQREPLISPSSLDSDTLFLPEWEMKVESRRKGREGEGRRAESLVAT